MTDNTIPTCCAHITSHVTAKLNLTCTKKQACDISVIPFQDSSRISSRVYRGNLKPSSRSTPASPSRSRSGGLNQAHQGQGTFDRCLSNLTTSYWKHVVSFLQDTETTQNVLAPRTKVTTPEEERRDKDHAALLEVIVTSLLTCWEKPRDNSHTRVAFLSHDNFNPRVTFLSRMSLSRIKQQPSALSPLSSHIFRRSRRRRRTFSRWERERSQTKAKRDPEHARQPHQRPGSSSRPRRASSS